MPASAPRRAVVLVADARAQLGEGPLWVAGEGRLYWLDILARRVHSQGPHGEHPRTLELAGLPGALVERAGGGFAIAWEHGFGAFDATTGAIAGWCDPERDLPGNRFNDGKVDAAGRFWAGTMAKDAPYDGKGALYRLDPDRRCTRVHGPVSISNGLAWSADGRTLYYIDTLTHEVAAFAVDPRTGALGGRRVCIRKDPGAMGLFDGMCIDAEGALWIAHWAGHCVTRWDPLRGELIERVELPVPNVTSCCFGGERLDTLFITTAAVTADTPRHPLAGGVFALRTGPIGLPPTAFAG